MSDAKTIRWLAAGAALVAAPVAGVRLYHTLAGPPAPTGAQPQPQGGPIRLNVVPEIDPALVRYQEVGRIDTHLRQAGSITVSRSGHVIVGGGETIQALPPDGGPSRSIHVDGKVTALALDEQGAIYAGVTDHVEILAPDGTPRAFWPTLGRDAYLTGIAVRGEQVYLADSGRRVVVHVDGAGKTLAEIGRPDLNRNIPGLLLPSPHLGVAIADDGSIWVNNAGLHRMENYSSDGTLERFWGTGGTDVEAFVGCCNPTDFWLLSDGSFVTTEKGIARVKHYLPDGRFESVVASPTSFAPNMIGLGIAVDPRGRVLVLERGTGLIHVFERIPGGAS